MTVVSQKSVTRHYNIHAPLKYKKEFEDFVRSYLERNLQKCNVSYSFMESKLLIEISDDNIIINKLDTQMEQFMRKYAINGQWVPNELKNKPEWQKF